MTTVCNNSARQAGRSVGAAGTPSGVLHELRVENLLLIERAELRLGPGLNVLTGETGAGKTVLAHALDLLLGGKPRAGIVRPGAAEAYVEGVFELPDALRGDARRPPAGRRRGARARAARERRGAHARVPRRPQRHGGDLREVGGALLVVLRPARAPPADARLGAARDPRRLLRPRAGRAPRRVRRRATRDVRGAARARWRSCARAPARASASSTCSSWSSREIEAADPSEAEEARAARRARAAAPPRGAARAAARRRARRSRRTSGEAAPRPRWPAPRRRRSRRSRGVDPQLDALAERAARARASRPTTSPASCAATARAIEARRRAGSTRSRSASTRSTRLERKHGGTIAAVLAHAESCRARRDELDGRRGGARGGDGARWTRRAGELAAAGRGAARRARGEAAPALAEAVRERLAELAMEGATFEVALSPRDEPGRPAATRSSS